MEKQILNNYFSWLCEKINGGENYDSLLLFLHSTKFTWVIENDKNRAFYGNRYRYEFANCDYYILEVLNNNLPDYCSVFEMLVALAEDCEFDIMHDPFKGNRTAKWFWDIFIGGLGLWVYTDDIFDDYVDEVTDIISGWLSHNYHSNGVGSPFPLHYPDEDCRNVEIWSLLNRYLYENYSDEY